MCWKSEHDNHVDVDVDLLASVSTLSETVSHTARHITREYSKRAEVCTTGQLLILSVGYTTRVLPCNLLQGHESSSPSSSTSVPNCWV